MIYEEIVGTGLLEWIVEIRKWSDQDREWVLRNAGPIGGARIVSMGVLHHLGDHEALVAMSEGDRVGFAVWRNTLPQVELIGLVATRQWAGIGTALMNELEKRVQGCDGLSICLCTTNDNLSALRFYQRRGYHIKAVHAGEFANVLRIKGFDPGTEVIGQDGIVIRDEIVLEKSLV